MIVKALRLCALCASAVVRSSKLRRRGYGDVAVGVQRPKRRFTSIGTWPAGDREIAAIVRLPCRLKAERAECTIGHFAAAHLDHQLANQRSLNHQSRQFFDFGDIVPVVVNTMAVEANRRKTEKQGRLRFEYFFPFHLARDYVTKVEKLPGLV